MDVARKNRVKVEKGSPKSASDGEESCGEDDDSDNSKVADVGLL